MNLIPSIMITLFSQHVDQCSNNYTISSILIVQFQFNSLTSIKHNDNVNICITVCHSI